jgi:hypothetical protein
VGELRSTSAAAEGLLQWRLAFGGLCLALLVGLVRILAAFPAPTFPDGDRAEIEIGVFHATRLEQFVGQFSHLHFNQLGPFYFYWLAPLYSASGYNSQALFLAVFLGSVASAMTVVLAVKHTLGSRPGMWACAVVATYMFCLSSTLVPDNWGPSILALPMFAALVLAAGAAAGRTRLLLPLGAFATFLVQSYIAVAPTLVLVLGVGAMLLLFSRDDRRCPLARSPRRGLWGAMTITTVSIMVLVWVPPAVAFLTQSPGNARAIFGFFTSVHPDLGSRPSFLVAALSVVNEATVVPFGRLWPDPMIPIAPRLAAAAVALSAALVAVVVGHRRHLPVARNLGVVSLFAFAGAVVSIQRIQGFVAPFVLFWSGTILLPGAIGALAALSAAAPDGALDTGRHRRSSPGQDVLVVLALVPTALLCWAFLTNAPMAQSSNYAGSIMSLVRPAVGDLRGHKVRLVTIDVGADPMAEGVGLQLLKSGAELHVSRGWAEKYGPPEARTGGEDLEVLVALAGQKIPPYGTPGAQHLGVVGPVEVWLRRLR